MAMEKDAVKLAAVSGFSTVCSLGRVNCCFCFIYIHMDNKHSLHNARCWLWIFITGQAQIFLVLPRTLFHQKRGEKKKLLNSAGT